MNDVRPFAATWMDLESHSETSKSDREGDILYDILICGIWKEIIQMNLLTKQEETHRLRKGTHGCQGEGLVQDFGKVMYTLLYLIWSANKNLLCRTRNSAQCYVPAWMEEGLRETRCMIISGWVPSPFTWNHHSIINWLNGSPLWCSCLENPTDRGTGGLQSMGSQESDATERLGTHIPQYKMFQVLKKKKEMQPLRLQPRPTESESAF